MFIRRACLDAVGLLREDAFAQGYGEENDFSLRARHLGWRHVAVPGAYVAHRGAGSFGAARAHLAARNAAVSLCLMIESRAGLEAAHDLAALDGVDYLSFGMMDLAQSLGHAGNPAHPDVKEAVGEASERVRAAGKRIREDFMKFAWVSEILVAGAKQILGD